MWKYLFVRRLGDKAAVTNTEMSYLQNDRIIKMCLSRSPMAVTVGQQFSLVVLIYDTGISLCLEKVSSIAMHKFALNLLEFYKVKLTTSSTCRKPVKY